MILLGERLMIKFALVATHIYIVCGLRTTIENYIKYKLNKLTFYGQINCIRHSKLTVDANCSLRFSGHAEGKIYQRSII